MTLRLSQIPARFLDGLPREDARWYARRGDLYLWHGRLEVWETIRELIPAGAVRVLCSTMPEEAITECKRRMLSRTVARVGGAT